MPSRFWIEVASGDRAWIRKRDSKEENVKGGLNAPIKTRYLNMFKEVSPGDFVFTYLTLNLTESREWRGAIVGVSKVVTYPYEKLGNLFIDTTNSLELPVPIKLSVIREKKGFLKVFQG